MKRHFLVILLTVSGCNNNLAASTQNALSSGGCTEKPPANLSLDKKDVKDISLNSGSLKESGKISAGKFIGYKFEAQAGQKLSYQTKDDICLWVYSPTNAVLNSGDLPETGSYIIQVSAPKGSTTFNLDLSLGALQATQSVPSSSASAPSPNAPSSNSVTPNVSPPPVSSASTTQQFSWSDFPKSSCGDSLPRDPNAYPITFYPVYVPYSDSNLDKAQLRLCQDAYRRTTKSTGRVVVQIASFKSQEKAINFKNFISGDFADAFIGSATVRQYN